jgi:hypothetical protein
MPLKKAIERAEQDRRQGKSASTQAGEFVREEIHQIRQGKHGARSTRQAIAIGLSEARRAVRPPPGKPPRPGRRGAPAASRDRHDRPAADPVDFSGRSVKSSRHSVNPRPTAPGTAPVAVPSGEW